MGCVLCEEGKEEQHAPRVKHRILEADSKPFPPEVTIVYPMIQKCLQGDEAEVLPWEAQPG